MSAHLKTTGLVAAGALLLAGLVWLVSYEVRGRYFQDTDDAVVAADSVTISAKLSGYVRGLAVADNQVVAQGAGLLDIDPTDYATRLAATRADLGSALAAVRAGGAAQAEAEAAAGTARAAAQAARVDADLAAREVERYQPLARTGAEPEEKLAQMEANRDRAVAELAGRQAAVVEAQARARSIGAQNAQLAAHGDAARVALQAADNDLAATHLVAPIAGQVASKTVRAGQFVQPGQRLLTIVPAGEAYVLANFKETQLGMMRPGQPAQIRVDALPGVRFAGVVESITPGTGANFSLIPPQNATGNFTKIVQRVPVRIRILAGPVARRVLVPGLSVEASVDTRGGAGEMDAIRAEADSAQR